MNLVWAIVVAVLISWLATWSYDRFVKKCGCA